MKLKIKSIIIYLPKIIIFCLALYNFISIWFEAKLSEGIGALVSPWYCPWSYYNEPSLLLYASAFLLFNKWRSNLISTFLSGYIIAKTIYLISIFGWLNWLEWLPNQWEFIKEYKIDILKEWEVQIVFAIIIFSFSIFYRVRGITRKNVLR